MISLVIALYNEEARIQTNCEKVRAYLEAHGEPWELILVDDGSRDGTLGRLRGLAERDSRIRVLALDRNRGQGAAVKLGMLAAKGDVALYSDADLPVPLETIKALVGLVRGGADVAVSSRWLPGARIGTPQPAARKVLGKAYYGLIHRFILSDIRDTNCGLKAYRGDAARSIFGLVRSRGWAFNVEHLWLARRAGCRVVELPVQWSHRDGSTVNIFRDCFFTLWELAWLKLREGAGLYPNAMIAPGRPC